MSVLRTKLRTGDISVKLPELIIPSGTIETQSDDWPVKSTQIAAFSTGSFQLM
jgi:hypothetical protein